MRNKTFNYLTLIAVVVATAMLVAQYFDAGSPVTFSTYAGLLFVVP